MPSWRSRHLKYPAQTESLSALMRNQTSRLSSLDLWKRYGGNLLVLQPFMDSLIERGEGCFLIDTDGRRILDLAAGQFCSLLGYGQQEFTERVGRQLDT